MQDLNTCRNFQKKKNSKPGRTCAQEAADRNCRAGRRSPRAELGRGPTGAPELDNKKVGINTDTSNRTWDLQIKTKEQTGRASEQILN
jgi:hypothetical protein